MNPVLIFGGRADAYGRGEILVWRAQRPDLYQRVAALGDAITAAGLDPDDWPYPRDTVKSAAWHLGMQAIRFEHGAERVVELLEERWRTQRRRRTGGRPEWPGWQAMLLARDRLRAEGKRGTQEEVAEHLKINVGTVKRRSRHNGRWPA